MIRLILEPKKGGQKMSNSHSSYKGYVNPQLLISPKDLSQRLYDGSTCVVDCRPTHEYAAGHIPNAVHLDLYGITLANTSRESLDAFMDMVGYLFQARGVDSTKTLIFYENISGIRAARGLWFCEYMGHEDVRVLDGGLKAWQAEGGEISTQCLEPPQANFNPNLKRHTHINADEISNSLQREDFAVLDVRSDDEHYGRVARAARGGCIPKSIHLEWTNNLDANGAFKTATELIEMYKKAGITPEKEVACY